MSLALSPRRAILMPGPWVRDELWRRARAVPSLDLRFADSKSLIDVVSGLSLITFTRVSSGTYVGSDGLLKTATTNEPRFDHNPTTGESLGLLVEESRTNLFVRSQELDNASWLKVRSTVTGDNTASPDGTQTAEKVIASTDVNTNHFVRQDISVVSGTSYTQTIFAKAAEYNQLYMGFDTDNSAFAGGSVIFTLTGLGSASATAGTLLSSSIQALSNGWYRCQISATATATATSVFRIQLATGGTNGFTGNGTSGLYLWGAQLEAGAFPTSYIPTTTATVTRSADVASITGTAFSGWYRQDEGTVFAEARTQQSSAGHVLAGVSTGSFTSSAYLSKESDNLLRAAPDAAPANLNITLQTVSTNVLMKSSLAFTAGTGSASAVMNGGTVGTDTSTGIPTTVDRFAIGCAPWNISTAFWNGTIRRVTYWPQRLSNSTLQTLTQ